MGLRGAYSAGEGRKRSRDYKMKSSNQRLGENQEVENKRGISSRGRASAF